MALAFRDSEALQVAIRSGLAPREVVGQPASVARDGGTVIVAPQRPLASGAIAKLRAAGVVVDAQLPPGVRAVSCWAEALEPIAVPVRAIPGLVLFVTEQREPLIDLAAELVRLGCDRLELLLTGEHGLARVVDPPTYTVMRGIDREHGLRVYAPDPPGQERVWTELGFRHPLAEHLRTEPGTLLLVAHDGWQTISDEGWADLDAALELAVPGHAAPYAASRMLERRRIELRLSAGRREVPSLWVIRSDAVAKVDKLLDYLPEDVVARLTFAVSGTGAAPTIVVRARTGRQAPPDLSLDGEEYAPLNQMPDVYAPAGSLVEPPLRRERLRTILAIDDREVIWLARVGETKFRVERIADDAFVPLSEWADYVLHANAPALEPWIRASVFEFAEFVSTGLEWASTRPSDGSARKRKKAKAVEPAPAPAAEPEVQAPRPPTLRAPRTTRRGHEVAPTPIEIDAELAALEAEFIALDATGDAPQRIELLDRLAHAYARLGRRRDAGLCFARAVWESPPAEARARLDAWIAADLRGTTAAKALEKALAQAVPSGDDVRLVALLTARAAAPVAKDPHRVARWLDDHDGELDARTLWLSRLGLAGLSGGDPLLLAHARDRILARLAGGLPVERELPAFLRLAGRSGPLGNTSGDHLANALEELEQRIARTKRKRTVLEAPPALTNAYVQLELAYGFARIGRADRARALVAESRHALASVDSVHDYLVAAFTARIEQAIAGMPIETPLPEELAAQLAAFDRSTRYKIDRLREVSRILEPLERLDASVVFIRGHKDSRGAEFAALHEIADLAKRAKAVDKLVDTAIANDAERGRLIEGILDVLLELPESAAVPILNRAWPVIAHVEESRRAVLYAESLVVAGHFGRTELVPEMLELLGGAIRTVNGPDLERVLHHSLRALRRIGLRAEIADLLAEAEHAMPPNHADAMRGKLALAGGLAFLGEFARAQPIFDQARTILGGALAVETRLPLTRSLAAAYSQAPLANALGGLAELAGQLRDISDNYGTNSHYCLSVLDFVESLVLGITSDDLALGEAGRRFIEDDEHLIRRRLHRDLSVPPGGPS